MSGHDYISSSERWPRINMRSKIIPFFILIINPLVGMVALIITIITPDKQWFIVFGVSIFVTLVYVTPPLEPYKKYFREKGYGNTVIEFELLKKILYVFIPVIVGLLLLTYIISYNGLMSYVAPPILWVAL
jgi:hypothetical protein